MATAFRLVRTVSPTTLLMALQAAQTFLAEVLDKHRTVSERLLLESSSDPSLSDQASQGCAELDDELARVNQLTDEVQRQLDDGVVVRCFSELGPALCR